MYTQSRIAYAFLLAYCLLPTLADAQRANDRETVLGQLGHPSPKDITNLEVKAAAGDAEAQAKLGLLCAYGRGLKKDLARAYVLFRSAAEQGNQEGQTNLGTMYFEGWGIAKNQSEAVRWWRKSAEQGSADAQFNLGEAYALGSGVRQDDAEAVKWYRKAAAQGEPDAQLHLGSMYATGRGVRKDMDEAKRWLLKASENGSSDARASLALLEAQQNGEAAHWSSPGNTTQGYQGMDQRLRVMAEQYKPYDVPRAVLDDVAWPRDSDEYVALNKHAVIMITAVSKNADELPPSRVYIRQQNGQEVELRRIWEIRRRNEDAVASVLGENRVDGFYLLPIKSYFEKAELVLDFVRNRRGFLVIQFPDKPPSAIANSDRDRSPHAGVTVSESLIRSFIKREYGVVVPQASGEQP